MNSSTRTFYVEFGHFCYFVGDDCCKPSKNFCKKKTSLYIYICCALRVDTVLLVQLPGVILGL
eukprot:COSAG01_NODE_144_length_24108_cov_11.490441_31_plen_63_part_00